MALTDYTSFDDIRAALGVSTDELDDTTLSLPLYEYNLNEELRAVDSTLASQFLGLSGSLSEDQQRFREATALFAAYAVAKQLLTSLPLFSPKEIGDGKAHMTRYAQDPYRATTKAVESAYEQSRTRLIAAFAVIKSVTAPVTTFRSYFTTVPASSDPVTGT